MKWGGYRCITFLPLPFFFCIGKSKLLVNYTKELTFNLNTGNAWALNPSPLFLIIAKIASGKLLLIITDSRWDLATSVSLLHSQEVRFQPEFTTTVLSVIVHPRQPEIPGHHTPCPHTPHTPYFHSQKISSNAASLKQTFQIPSSDARFTVLYPSSKLPHSYLFVFCAVDQFYLVYLYLTFPPKLPGPWGQGLYLTHLDPSPSPPEYQASASCRGQTLTKCLWTGNAHTIPVASFSKELLSTGRWREGYKEDGIV